MQGGKNGLPGIIVAGGGRAAQFERFEGEAAFRRATGTPAVVRVVPGLFALYAILVVALRRRGADSIDAP